MTATIARPAPVPPQQLGAAETGETDEGQRHWLLSLAMFAAVMLASLSLNGVFFGWSWLGPLTLTVASVLAGMGLARTLRLPSGLVPVAGLLALIAALTWEFFPNQSILGVIPVRDALPQLQVLLLQAESTVVSQVAPVLPGSGIFLVVCAGVGLITVLADTLANTLRMPASSGLALLAILVVPAAVKINSLGVPGFLAAALGYLGVLGCAQWLEQRRTAAGGVSGGWISRGLGIAAAALAVTVLLPLAVPGFNVGAFPQGARVNIWGGATGLNPSVTLGNDLRNPTGFGRIDYATNAEKPLYLRMVTLEDFSGQRWEPEQRVENRELGLIEMGTGAVRSAIDTGVNTVTRISAQSFTSPWLLAPYAPVSVRDLTGRWAWDPQNLSIMSVDGSTTAQQEYVVRSAEPELTREVLAGIGPAPEGAVPERLTTLPADTPGIITQTTEAITGDISNPYEQAMAIQQYLRGPDFVYSLDAPVDGGYDGSSLDVMARFLESKAGYCVHYAGTMAVMARVAGIPSRVAVGYAPGAPTGQTFLGPLREELTGYSVTSKDAHAWPELYFDGVGWVRFEPTPSRGVVPDYAQAPATPVAPAVDPENLNPGALPGATGTPGTAAPVEASGGVSGGGQGERNRIVTVGFLSMLALLAFGPFLLRGARSHRRRLRVASAAGTGTGSASLAWEETTETAVDYGYAAKPTDTPRTFAGRLREHSGIEGEPAESLTRLRRAFEREEYADGAGGAAADGAGGAAWNDVQSVTGALRRSRPWSTRLRARFLPRSLWPRNRRMH